MSEVRAVPAGVTRPGARPRARPRWALDSATTALILGIAAMAWFGWGQDRPPPGAGLAGDARPSFLTGASGGLVCLACAGYRLYQGYRGDV